MNKTSSTENRASREQVKMRKYIVEAPEPKIGQKVSTGGIREKGKMAVPFKNPVPYEEPETSTTKMVPVSTKNISKKVDKTIYWEAGKYFLGLVWKNFGEPVVETWLQEKGQELSRSITEQSKHSQESEIIDVPKEDVVVVAANDNKIVPFQANRLKTSVHG